MTASVPLSALHALGIRYLNAEPAADDERFPGRLAPPPASMPQPAYPYTNPSRRLPAPASMPTTSSATWAPTAPSPRRSPAPARPGAPSS